MGMYQDLMEGGRSVERSLLRNVSLGSITLGLSKGIGRRMAAVRMIVGRNGVTRACTTTIARVAVKETRAAKGVMYVAWRETRVKDAFARQTSALCWGVNELLGLVVQRWRRVMRERVVTVVVVERILTRVLCTRVSKGTNGCVNTSSVCRAKRVLGGGERESAERRGRSEEGGAKRAERRGRSEEGGAKRAVQNALCSSRRSE